MKKNILLCAVVFWLGFAGMAWGQSSAVNAFVNDPALRAASLGIYIAHVETGEVLASYNERQANIPASTMKLVTTATALRLLGPSFTPTTRVDCVGEIDSCGVLQGDLVVRGGGDATLGSRYGSRGQTDFAQTVVQSLQERGIRAITGGIRVDNSYFGGYVTSPRIMLEDLTWDYGTPCHALNYRDNRLDIELKSVGQRYKVVDLSPAGVWQVDVDLVKGSDEDVRVEREGNRWLVSGTIPRNKEEYTLRLADHHPDEVLVHELTQYLTRAGIGVAKEGDKSSSAQVTTLLQYRGDSLGYVVNTLNRRSDNLFAETVLRQLPAEGKACKSAANGLETIRRYWQSYGVDPNFLFQYDGSGLVRNNKMSAIYLAQILKIMAQDSVVGEDFVNSLPLVGKEGTVKYFMQGHNLPGKLRLKTGSMKDVQAYAGYYITPYNRYVVIVTVNNYTCSRRELRTKIATMLTRALPSK